MGQLRECGYTDLTGIDISPKPSRFAATEIWEMSE